MSVQNSVDLKDHERMHDRWLGVRESNLKLPVMERIYLNVVVLLLTGGLRGVAEAKTATIAKWSGINESTLFRYIDKRDQLVADAVDWCWKNVNDEISAAHHENPLVGTQAEDLILLDLRTMLGMFEDPVKQLYGTGALLSFRRSERLYGNFEPIHQLRFRRRLETLAFSLIEDRDLGEHDAEYISNYMTNYLATAWFTWIADPESRGPSGLVTKMLVENHWREVLEIFSGRTSDWNRNT